MAESEVRDDGHPRGIRESVGHEQRLAALRACFNVAIRNGKAESNPAIGTRFLRENNGRLKYLPSPEAERALLNAVPDARRQEMIEIAIHTGLRWSEQRGLRWRGLAPVW